ncbi:10471_t:CDS:2, partial [Racocetra fulgida]
IEFEKKVVNLLKNVDDHNNTSFSEILKTLQNAQIGRFLYKLKFEVPDDLYDKLGIKNVRLRPFIPDFIEVIEEGGKKCLMIWDAKATKETRISHQCGISISRKGGIFLPSEDGLKRQTFSIDLPKVERFLCKELPQIVSTPEVSWHYNSRCKACEFVNECREEAKGTIAMIPYLSKGDALYLKQVIRNERRGDKPYNHEPDFEELVSYVKNGPNDDKTIQIIKFDKNSKKSPYLESKTNAQYKAMQRILNIFQYRSFLSAFGNNVDKSSKLPDELREFPRLIVLEQSLKENIAIYTPGFYRIIDVWEQMVRPTLKNNQILGDLEFYIPKIDLEDIYTTWVSTTADKEVINKTLLMRSKFVNSVIHAYYALLKKVDK